MNSEIMKIVNVEVYELEIPIDLGTSSIPSPQNFLKGKSLDFCLVKIETDDGVVGWGDAFSYNCRQAVALAIQHMVKPLLMNKDPRDILGINSMLQKSLHLYGRYGITMFAISGVDIALWDILGKRLNKPLYQIFGADGTYQIPAYASLWRYENPDVVVDRLGMAKADGYTKVKLHEIGIDEVRAARDFLGNDFPLMLDTNCPWSYNEAKEKARAFKEFDLYWLEEPINPPEDFEGLAKLKNDCGLSIASGENACTSYQFKEMLLKQAVDFAQPSVTKVGGITEFRKVSAICESWGVQIMPHSPYFGPGFLATLHMAQSSISPGFVERLFVNLEANLYSESILNPNNGAFTVLHGAGLGEDPDLDVIKTYQKK